MSERASASRRRRPAASAPGGAHAYADACSIWMQLAARARAMAPTDPPPPPPPPPPTPPPQPSSDAAAPAAGSGRPRRDSAGRQPDSAQLEWRGLTPIFNGARGCGGAQAFALPRRSRRGGGRFFRPARAACAARGWKNAETASPHVPSVSPSTVLCLWLRDHVSNHKFSCAPGMQNHSGKGQRFTVRRLARCREA